MAPVFEMFNHAEDNNAFFDFDKINKKLYVAAIKERISRTRICTELLIGSPAPIKSPLNPGQGY